MPTARSARCSHDRHEHRKDTLIKILVLNGSPKKKSDTFRMTERFLVGLNHEETHDVSVVNVIDLRADE